MNNSEKKFWLDFTGYFISRPHNSDPVYADKKDTLIQGYLKDYNPDTNPDQFRKIWNRLIEKQKKSVGNKFLVLTYMPNVTYPSGIEYGFRTGVELVLNELPKVMDVVMEVIDEKG